MIIGIPRSRHTDEYRVALPPRGVRNLTAAGAEVIVERKAGYEAGFPDSVYENSGARIVHDVQEVYGRADLIAKVNRPIPEEYDLIREGQTIMGFLHLAVADPKLVGILRSRRCTAIDFATIQDDNGSLPVLRVVSQIAGRMVPQIAAKYLQTDHGGLGILLGGAPAVPPAEVVVIGAGTVGRHAVRACVGAGAQVTLMDADFDRIAEIDWALSGQVTTFLANEATLRKALAYADVVVGAVQIPGTRTPHLVSKEMVGLLREKSLIIDISVDSGGCFETSRPTRLSDPIYVIDGITHYCVPNLTSLVGRSTSYAMSNATLPYLCALSRQGVREAIAEDSALARGAHLVDGEITHPGLAAGLGVECRDLKSWLAGGDS